MIPPLPLPDWIPWWGHLAILIAGLLFVLMFILMPFSVFGVKGRLDLLEARLDEIQGEIRSLSLRLPEPGLGETRALPAGRRTADLEGYAGMHGYPDSDEYGGQRPPIPPAPRDRRPPAAPSRTEPRLY